MSVDHELQKRRGFLKDTIRLETDFSKTDQSLGKEPPPVQKEIPPQSKTIPLLKPTEWTKRKDAGVHTAIANRESHRRFSDSALSTEELSFLLWATQGVRKIRGKNVWRNVPSAGNRHPFDTYLCIRNVSGIECGIYLYLPLSHQLVCQQSLAPQELAEKIGIAALGQYFIGTAPVAFIWAAVPYRTEWRYGAASHKVIALDAGHVCQNLYIACEAIDAGTCAIAAYHQNLMDELIGVDGKEAFVIYLAPVGKRT